MPCYKHCARRRSSFEFCYRRVQKISERHSAGLLNKALGQESKVKPSNPHLAKVPRTVSIELVEPGVIIEGRDLHDKIYVRTFVSSHINRIKRNNRK